MEEKIVQTDAGKIGQLSFI